MKAKPIIGENGNVLVTWKLGSVNDWNKLLERAQFYDDLIDTNHELKSELDICKKSIRGYIEQIDDLDIAMDAQEKQIADLQGKVVDEQRIWVDKVEWLAASDKIQRYRRMYFDLENENFSLRKQNEERAARIDALQSRLNTYEKIDDERDKRIEETVRRLEENLDERESSQGERMVTNWEGKYDR